MIASRSVVVRSGVQLASPFAVLVATYLFFAGHNQPGGGFAAGLVLAAVVALRTMVGLRHPVRAVPCLVVGGVVVAAVALAPLFGGSELIDQVVVTADLPVLGTVKTGSALIFDAGVTLIVVGLVVAILDSLGATELGMSAPGHASAEEQRT